jgi:hypothetical protein
MSHQNRFHWVERVSCRDSQRLYKSDAHGMLNVELHVIQGTTDQVPELDVRDAIDRRNDR